MPPHSRPPHARSAALILVAATLLLGGCYKSQYETEKTRAAELEKKAKDLQAALDQAKTDLGTTQTRVQALETQLNGLRAGGSLVSFVDGKPAGQEAIRWDGTQWVRHGECTRGLNTLKFENGRLADQTLMIFQPGGKPWYTGGVKFGKPDGEWIWFDDAGKPHMRETWAAGRLTEVARASTAKGPLTWGRLNTKDREAWVKSSSTALRDLPEVSRDTSPPPAPAAASAAKPAPAKTSKPAR